jgi:hypothetical protein
MAAVLEVDLDGIADVALFRVEVVGGELRVLHHLHLLAQGVDARVGGDGVGVVVGGQAPKISGTAIMYCRQWSRSA